MSIMWHGYDGEDTAYGGGYKPTHKNSYVYEPISYYSRLVLEGSVLNFVFMAFYLIPEAECGQSPRSLANIENFADF